MVSDGWLQMPWPAYASMLVIVSFAEQPEPLELVVAPDGSGVVAADELARLGLGPGMHLKVVPVSETEPVRPARRSVRGILTGTAAVPSWADFEQASQTAIADVEARYGPGGRWAADNR